MEKKIIRQYIRSEKQCRSISDLLHESEQILGLLETHPRFQKAQTVLAYHALPDEPSTQLRLDRWAESKRILLPVVVGDMLHIREYHGASSMREGPFHILEPQGPRFTDFRAIELALIPGVAFDIDCNRLGRGRGFYDRLLSMPDFAQVYKLGIAFSFQKIAKVPIDPQDVRMDEVL